MTKDQRANRVLLWVVLGAALATIASICTGCLP